MQAGDHVSPSIRLVRPLGQGGMGRVWLAEHLALKTEVVVKMMSDEIAGDGESRDRFSREAVAASNVKSPHVVQTYDHGVTPEGVPFIVMERLEGEDLSHRVGRGPMSVPEVAPVVAQVCLALARAHQGGVIHRDIKPDNIFLCDVGGEQPFVKLLDFGIAKTDQSPGVSSNTRTGAMMGTPYYMSPEHFAGAKNVDARSDLWSLGVVVFECLTGERPFQAETVGGLAIAVHSTPIRAPSALRRGLPPSIDAWMARACARNPADRFQTARELAEGFAEAAQGIDALAATEPEPDEPAPVARAQTPLPFGRTPPGQPAQSAAPPLSSAPPASLLMTTGAIAASASNVPDAEPVVIPRRPVTAYVLAGVAALLVLGVGAALTLARAPASEQAPAVTQSPSSHPEPPVALAPASTAPPAPAPPPSAAAATTPAPGRAGPPAVAAPPPSSPVRPAASAAPRPSGAAKPGDDPFGNHVF